MKKIEPRILTEFSSLGRKEITVVSPPYRTFPFELIVYTGNVIQILTLYTYVLHPNCIAYMSGLFDVSPSFMVENCLSKLCLFIGFNSKHRRPLTEIKCDIPNINIFAITV